MKSGIASVFKNSQRFLAPITAPFIKTKTDTAESETVYSKRQIRIAVSAFFFCHGICFASWASRIPDIKTALELSNAALGNILFALPVGQLLAMPFSGRLVTYFGSKKVLRVSIILYAICLTNLALATQPWHLAAGLLLFGICSNLCNISVNTQAIRAEKLYARPIMTSFHGVWSIAGFTGGALGLLMVSQKVSPYVHFWIAAALIFVIVIGLQAYLQSGQATMPTEKKPFFSKPDGVLVQLGVIGFFSMASEGAMFEWSGVYFKDIVQAPPSLIVLGYLSFMTTMASGRLMGDRLIAKYGRPTMLRISGVLISTGFFLSVLFPHIITAVAGFLLIGFGVSSIVPMVFSAAGKHSKISPGMALAAVSSISFFGFLIGPPLIGYIAEMFSLRYSFAVIGLLGIMISLMVSRIKALN